MTDDPATPRSDDARAAGISRRRLLGTTALGLAGALLSTPSLTTPAAAIGHGHRGRRLLIKDGIVLTLDRRSATSPRATSSSKTARSKRWAPACTPARPR